MSVFSPMVAAGHEEVCFFHDPGTGLRAIVAVHSTRRGPGIGGVRIRDYGDDGEALTDVLRLSEAMSYKAACAGLPCGGAKAVVMGPFPADRAAGMHALAGCIERLGGRYIATEDMGMNESDIARLNDVTRFAVGRALADGGSGDPSPHTARGVVCGMRSALRSAGMSGDFQGLKVAVQGCGSVGLGVIERLLAGGAEVHASDIDVAAGESARRAGARIVPNDEILAADVDVLAPCGIGAVLNERSIPEIRARVIAGAANNQLAGAADAERLMERDIVYAPDFVINAGGLINVADEIDPAGYDGRRVAGRVANIEITLDRIFAEAGRTGKTSAAIALELAHSLIDS
ncbi:Glu/Leu/Phe/Val dehydrogenase family protein [Salinisphaera sp.]|uniref:Glu/Leu/Phe/Val dehydrogenase family protein n=1 Tax=Salinisphaera sp. TaxID=1914330 RepID=UPI002D7A029D|nr:Glu/Leu/Phe/Val dehydrogenase dimerization domain-containing protein [Salinisphaera sp.]HET7314942.1 Glu/Leu/Phe/Val dehydrogenase dimerization domain-containing protein [Salinisphaera sp.]